MELRYGKAAPGTDRWSHRIQFYSGHLLIFATLCKLLDLCEI